MAITTLDNALAGAGFPNFFFKSASGTLSPGLAYSYWYADGIPGAAAIPTLLGMDGAALTAPVQGQIPYINPTSPDLNYLGRLAGVAAAQGGTLILADRLWHNYGIDLTDTNPQTVNSVAYPPRDFGGTSAGQGVFFGLEILSATGAASPLITVNYLDTALDPQVATTTIPTSGSVPAGTFYQFALAGAADGVSEITAITFSTSWLSGSAQLVAYRPIAAIMCPAAGVSSALDPLTGGLPLMFDDSVPFVLFLPSTTTPTPVSGSVTFTQG